MHVDNLDACLRRGALHAPNFFPDDGLQYRTIHDTDIQQQRRATEIPCGPGGVVHDYVSFYFGPRSPMLLRLHTGRVLGYSDGQAPLIYLVSTAQAIREAGGRFVFSDGHGIALFSTWYDDLADLDKVDWVAVHARFWKDTIEDMDRQRRKQAEFLVHRQCEWSWIHEIGVLDDTIARRVEDVFRAHDPAKRRPVHRRPDWYYL